MHPVQDRERRPHGARRIVLVRPRDAEGRHHRVAGELLDRAAVQLDAPRRPVEVLVHAPPDDLRIGRRDQRRRIDEIDEQHARKLALHA